MAQVPLFLRDTGLEVGLGIATSPDFTGSGQEVPLNTGTFDSLSLELGLSNNEGIFELTDLYTKVQLLTGGEPTVETSLDFLISNSGIPNDDILRWYTIEFTDGPYYLGATNPRVRVFMNQIPAGPSSLVSWHAEQGWTSRKWFRLYGNTLEAPNKPVNPTPAHVDEGVLLNLTVGWEKG